MSQKLGLGGVKWLEDTSQFNKDFMENYIVRKGYFLEIIHNDLPFFG